MVVFERDRVSAASALARADGVSEDMRRGGVQLLSPQALQHERDVLRESAALEETALALLQYTPQATLAEDACVLLDIGASLRLFGGIRALCRRVQASVARLGFTISLGCAPTAAGAWLLARSGVLQVRRVLRLPRLQARLNQLPVGLLSAATPYLEWLHGIGCRQLGHLRRLPRAGLQRRCGKPLLQMLDQAYGAAPELHQWISAPPSFHARQELPDRIEQAEILLAYARKLLEQMCGWLSARQLAVKQIVLQMEHERGRQAVAPTVITLTLADAIWQDTHLEQLLKERLARTELQKPAIAMNLSAGQVESMQLASDALFPEPGGTPEDHHRLIELLTARLGPEHVLQAAPLADHRPEVSNRWQSVTDLSRTRAAALPSAPSALPPRPLWLLEQPIPLRLRQHKPFYGTPLHMVSTAERIEAGWWQEQQTTRDYYVACDERHVHYWIFKEWRRDAHQEHAHTEPHWFLHGLFA